MFGLFENTDFLPSQLQWTCCFLWDLTVCNRINLQKKKRDYFSRCVAFFLFFVLNRNLDRVAPTNASLNETTSMDVKLKSSGSLQR